MMQPFEANRANIYTRYQTIERSFANHKELHGLRNYRFRRIKEVQQQALLTAAYQNIKKIAKILGKRTR